MGGSKKKSLTSSEKTTSAEGPGEAKPIKKEEFKKAGSGKPQQRQRLTVQIEDTLGRKGLQNMKAITIQAFARSSGVKISVANAYIKSLEAKGILKSVGGYSGHRVYELTEHGLQ